MAKATRLTEQERAEATKSIAILLTLVDAMAHDLSRDESKRVMREDVRGVRQELDRLEETLAYKEPPAGIEPATFRLQGERSAI